MTELTEEEGNKSNRQVFVKQVMTATNNTRNVVCGTYFILSVKEAKIETH